MWLNDGILHHLEVTWLQATLGIRDHSSSSRPVSETERTAAVNACLGIFPLLIHELEEARENGRRWLRQAEQHENRVMELTRELETTRQHLQALEQPALTD